MCSLFVYSPPIKNVKSQTPQEAWIGVKPRVNHLKDFGSIAYAHVPDQGRSKLDYKSVKQVFIGYDASSKGYKLYNPCNEKIIVNKDVKFDEEKIWNWEKEETYDLFPYFEENVEEVAAPNEFSTPPPLPTQFIHEAWSSKGSSSERPRKMRSLQEIYDETEIINDLLSFCWQWVFNLWRSYERQKVKTRHGWWNQCHQEEWYLGVIKTS